MTIVERVQQLSLDQQMDRTDRCFQGDNKAHTHCIPLEYPIVTVCESVSCHDPIIVISPTNHFDESAIFQKTVTESKQYLALNHARGTLRVSESVSDRSRTTEMERKQNNQKRKFVPRDKSGSMQLN